MKVPVAEAPEGLKELVNQFSDDYEVYVSEESSNGGCPTSFEEAMEVKMNSMNTNDVWDLEEIPNRAKIVGYNGSTRQR